MERSDDHVDDEGGREPDKERADTGGDYWRGEFLRLVEMAEVTPRFSGGTPNPSPFDQETVFAAPNITTATFPGWLKLREKRRWVLPLSLA